MSVRTYDPKQIIFSVGGNIMQGFAEGTFIVIADDEDRFTKVVGADGTVSRAKSNNTSTTVTATFKRTSPSNDVLSSIARDDEIANLGVVPILIKDLNGPSLMQADAAWIQARPDEEHSKEVDDREWVIATGPARRVIGGSN
jgi:hypothetical protein